MKVFKNFVNELNECIRTDKLNLVRGLLENETIRIPTLTNEDVEAIAKELDYKLAPEILHQDGEISAAEANRKGRKLMAVVHSLRKYCNKYKLKTPNIMEAWD